MWIATLPESGPAVNQEEAPKPPPAPWGTSPVGSPRLQNADGAPLRYGSQGAVSTPLKSNCLSCTKILGSGLNRSWRPAGPIEDNPPYFY